MSEPRDEENRPQPRYGQYAPGYGQQDASNQSGAPSEANLGQPGPSGASYGQPQTSYGQQPANVWNQANQAPATWGPPQNLWSQPTGRPQHMPSTVNVGSWLILVAGALAAVQSFLVLMLMNTAEFRSDFNSSFQEAAAQQGGNPGVSVDEIHRAMIASVVAFTVVALIIYLVVFFGVRKGKNWARILGTVFAGLSLLLIWAFPLGTLATLLGIVGIILLYLNASRPWFNPQQYQGPPSYPNQPYQSQPYPGQQYSPQQYPAAPPTQPQSDQRQSDQPQPPAAEGNNVGKNWGP